MSEASARAVVTACYQELLGRAPDEAGLAHYAARLHEGMSRESLEEILRASDEYLDRQKRIAPPSTRIPRDVQLCELANPAKWDNPEWIAGLKSLHAAPIDKAQMHRKAYELGQTIFGLRRLGALTASATILSVGAGHEPILYWLANQVRMVYATDLYEGIWQSEFAREGAPEVLQDPSTFAPFEYRRDRLVFMRMDGSRLAFHDRSFDVVYSLSSIEHFGGIEGARRSIADMARVLVPGGILALATEWCVRGTAAGEVFAPEDIRRLIDHPSLALVQPIDDKVWDRYETDPVDLWIDRLQTPHMLLKDRDTTFTSVMMFLRKI